MWPALFLRAAVADTSRPEIFSVTLRSRAEAEKYASGELPDRVMCLRAAAIFLCKAPKICSQKRPAGISISRRSAVLCKWAVWEAGKNCARRLLRNRPNPRSRGRERVLQVPSRITLRPMRVMKTCPRLKYPQARGTLGLTALFGNCRARSKIFGGALFELIRPSSKKD